MRCNRKRKHETDRAHKGASTMKQFLMLLLAFFFVSCGTALDPFSVANDEMNYKLAEKIHLCSGNWSSINRIEDITPWIKKNLVYKSDDINEWDSPAVALARGYGDCEEFCFVFMNIAYVRLGMKFILAGVLNTERTIKEGGIYDHFIVILPDGTQYEPQSGHTVQYDIKYSYTFDEIF
jgi:hypothetical protein